MPKCSWCGRENDAAAQACGGCGILLSKAQDPAPASPGVEIEEDNQQKPARPFPFFGILSVLVPVAGLICQLAIQDHSGTRGDMGNDTRLYLFWTTLAFGLVPILGAWLRHERYLILRFIGLLFLSPYLLLALFYILLRTSHNWHM